ncbi:contractile injection system tape measure protein [Mangrovibacterium sp.]|uniref:contractile injection system tape measure protein n=1 Tax=Mangrovibacterium sp. TaxID=1961364 RepID=UPI003561A0F1
MSEQKHLINREVLELTVSDRQRAEFIHQKISQMIEKKLNPALDQLFTSVATKNETIRIDELVLDLGVVSESELQQAIVELTIREALEKISKLIKANRDVVMQKVEKNKRRVSSVKLVSAKDEILEQFVYFLATGHFPWWSRQTGSNQLNELFAQVLELSAKSLNRILVPELRNPNVRKRLIFQFREDQIEALLRRIDGRKYRKIEELSLILFLNVASKKFKKVIANYYDELLLLYFAYGISLNSQSKKAGLLKHIIEEGLNRVSSHEGEAVLVGILERILYSSQSGKTEGCLKRAVVEVVAERMLTRKSDLDSPKIANDETQFVEQYLVDWFLEKRKKISVKDIARLKLIMTYSRHSKSNDQLQDAEPEFFISLKKEAKETEKIESISLADEEIHVGNAGLVLLHPFLSVLFRGLNLLDDEQQFKSRTHACKAVHILQYLVADQLITAEYELALNKILCGLDVAEPIPNSGDLSASEQDECLHLIKTVLERWSALKTENPKALQENYLCRKGILRKTGAGWTLIVERNTIDVMLDRLPWAISIVKFPWTEQILHVEW